MILVKFEVLIQVMTKKNIKVSYFDTRSSAKAINSGLNDFNIELISNSYYHEIEKVIPIYYERDNQNYS